jgi:formylglycine-generating enzyme required for sulfatase activity
MAGLAAAGFEPKLDKHDIAAGEKWEARLGALIEAADTVVFIISPDAIASKRCEWELEHTEELKKRLLPIVWRGVEEVQVPPRLKQLNYIFFDHPHSFGPSLLALATALKTDIKWVREHTRLGEAALRWGSRGRVDALLLRGEELAAAKDWLKAQPKFALEPTLLMHEFINAGKDAEAVRTTNERQRLDQIAAAQDEREKALEGERVALRQAQTALRNRKRLLGAVGLLLGCIIVGMIGWFNRTYLEEQYYWHFKMSPSLRTAGRERALRPKDEFEDCKTGCPRMVIIAAGRFNMGSPEGRGSGSERPRHEVVIAKPFAIGKYEVTFAEWDMCVAAGACSHQKDRWGRNVPIVYVTWEESEQYATWLSRITGRSYRLPSEAEWERAARAGSDTDYSWGTDIGKGNANCSECGSEWDGKRPAPVASPAFKPNAFGLLNMHGNVWEWVQDYWHNSYDGAPADGTARLNSSDDFENIRVVRGGSFGDKPDLIRSAKRDSQAAGYKALNLGFRIARTLTE